MRGGKHFFPKLKRNAASNKNSSKKPKLTKRPAVFTSSPWYEQTALLMSAARKTWLAPNEQNVSQAPRRETTCPTLDYLQADHPAVEAVGFDEKTASALGIGYASKGLMKGTVAVSIRLEDGTISGYIGITEAKLPPRFQLTTNVVPFGKKIA